MAIGASYVFDVKMNPGGGNKVICNTWVPKFGGATIRISKSTDGTTWSDVISNEDGAYAEIGLSNSTTSFAIYHTYGPTTVQPGYLKQISNLSTVTNNTAAGSSVWYCVDLDNWSGANKYVLAGDQNGLYRSNDAGVTWFAI